MIRVPSFLWDRTRVYAKYVIQMSMSLQGKRTFYIIRWKNRTLKPVQWFGITTEFHLCPKKNNPLCIYTIWVNVTGNTESKIWIDMWRFPAYSRLRGQLWQVNLVYRYETNLSGCHNKYFFSPVPINHLFCSRILCNDSGHSQDRGSGNLVSWRNR